MLKLHHNKLHTVNRNQLDSLKLKEEGGRGEEQREVEKGKGGTGEYGGNRRVWGEHERSRVETG